MNSINTPSSSPLNFHSDSEDEDDDPFFSPLEEAKNTIRQIGEIFKSRSQSIRSQGDFDQETVNLMQDNAFFEPAKETVQTLTQLKKGLEEIQEKQQDHVRENTHDYEKKNALIRHLNETAIPRLHRALEEAKSTALADFLLTAAENGATRIADLTHDPAAQTRRPQISHQGAGDVKRVAQYVLDLINKIEGHHAIHDT